MRLSKFELLKQITHIEAVGEFLLANQEVNIEDKEWMLNETNRSFKRWGVPIRTVDVEFEKSQIFWHVEPA